MGTVEITRDDLDDNADVLSEALDAYFAAADDLPLGHEVADCVRWYREKAERCERLAQDPRLFNLTRDSMRERYPDDFKEGRNAAEKPYLLARHLLEDLGRR